MFTTILMFVSVMHCLGTNPLSDYLKKREDLVKESSTIRFDNQMIVARGPKEIKLNSILTKMKNYEQSLFPFVGSLPFADVKTRFRQKNDSLSIINTLRNLYQYSLYDLSLF